MRVFVEAVSGPGQGNRIPVAQNQVVTVGRTEWSDICIPNDPQMSGKHLQIEHSGGDVRIADLNSTNGTMVNGQFIKQASLKSGDEIVAGSTVFVVHIEQSGATSGEPTGQSLNATSMPDQTPAPAHSPFSTPPQPTSNTGQPPATPVGDFHSPIYIPSETSPSAPTPQSGAQPPSPPPDTGQTPFSTPIQVDSPSSTPPAQPPPRQPAPTQLPPRQPTPTQSTAHQVQPGQPPVAAPSSESSFSNAEQRSPIVAAETPAGGRQPAEAMQPQRPASDIVLDERRQFVAAQSSDSRLFQSAAQSNGLMIAESFPPADPQRPGATGVALQLNQIGQLAVIAHFAKAEQELPEDLSVTPLFHWLPPESARNFGPVIVMPQPENAHLHLLDQLWGNDSVMAVCGADIDKVREHLLDLILYNPHGFGRSKSLFGFCWPSGLLQICRNSPADTVDAVFGDAVQFFMVESSSQPGAWCVIGKPGIESTLVQIGFQQLAEEPSAER